MTTADQLREELFIVSKAFEALSRRGDTDSRKVCDELLSIMVRLRRELHEREDGPRAA